MVSMKITKENFESIKRVAVRMDKPSPRAIGFG
jgi:hypothetical protein